MYDVPRILTMLTMLTTPPCVCMYICFYLMPPVCVCMDIPSLLDNADEHDDS